MRSTLKQGSINSKKSDLRAFPCPKVVVDASVGSTSKNVQVSILCRSCCCYAICCNSILMAGDGRIALLFLMHAFDGVDMLRMVYRSARCKNAAPQWCV